MFERIAFKIKRNSTIKEFDALTPHLSTWRRPFVIERINTLIIKLITDSYAYALIKDTVDHPLLDKIRLYNLNRQTFSPDDTSSAAIQDAFYARPGDPTLATQIANQLVNTEQPKP